MPNQLAHETSPLSAITRVVISHDQITINKSAQADWPVIGKSIGAAIRAHLATDDPAVSDAAWDDVPSSEEIREHVQQVLDTEINPSVAAHGGVVRLIDVKDNQVFIQMGGGCQGGGQAARALGLTEGPTHAELRLAKDGPSVIEVNARSIGGLCSRVLRFRNGTSSEALVIRHALEEDFELSKRQSQATGVMMIPTACAGWFVEVRGLAEAKTVSGIEDVAISAHLGQRWVPLPERSRYLGFIFAQANSPPAVEAALREAHSRLKVVMEPSVDRAREHGRTSRTAKTTEAV